MQHDRADNPYHSYMVEASAGTGKTYISTHRYLHLVAAHAPIAEIIAITFTDKAAIEMRERVVQLASDMSTNHERQQEFDQQMHAFHQQLDFAAKEPKPGQQVANEILQQSQRMRIKTIDSLVQEWLILLASKQLHKSLHYPLVVLEPDEIQDIKREVWDKLWRKSLHDDAHAILASEEPIASIQQRVEALLSKRGVGLAEIETQYVEHQVARDADAKTASYLDNLNSKGRAYIKLASHFGRLYQEHKQALGKYEFDDLLASLHHSIHADAGVLYELQHHISHMLIDEFQDTNDTQWEVFQPICAELMAGDNLIATKHGIRSTVFMVGDKKQTIYAFRGANPKIMNHAADSLPHIKHAALQKNYRTTTHLIDFYNQLFPNVKLKDFREHTSACEDTSDSAIKIVNINKQDKQTKQQTVEIEAEYVANQIQATLAQGDVSAEDICILYRGKNYADTFAAALAKRGIPYNKNESKSIHIYQAITDLIALCKWLLVPKDTCALLTVVRSQGASINAALAARSNDYQTILAQLKDRRLASHLSYLCANRHLPAYELVATALFKYDFLARYRDESAQHNAIKFLDMLVEMAAKGISSLAAVGCKLAKNLEFQGLRPSNAVSLMTVHKAKGLEFRDVYLVQTGDCWAKTDKYWHVDDGQIKYIGTSAKRPKELTAMLNASKQRCVANEETRLLYVAMTRAKHSLTVTGVEQTKQPAFLPSIRQTAEQAGFSCHTEEVCPPSQQRTARQPTDESSPMLDTSTYLVMVSKSIATLPATDDKPTMPEDSSPKANSSSMPAPIAARNSQNTEIKTLRSSARQTTKLRWTQKSLQGIYVHKMLERAANHLPYHDSSYWQHLVSGIISATSDKLLAQANESISAFVASNTWKELFSDVCWLKTEQRVSGFKDNTFTHGIIDLLLCYPHSRLLVVDYKTSDAPIYHGQLARYEAIIKAMYPSHKVNAIVVVVPL